jgi:DNA-binding transcriptional regulator YiaG
MKQRPKQAKLTPDAVRYIRSNPKGMTRKQLAAQFGVVEHTVARSAWYVTWRYLA